MATTGKEKWGRCHDNKMPSNEQFAGNQLTLAGFASLAMSHVVQDVLHGATVRKVALPHFPIGLLPPLALVRVEQEDQLLLNKLPLLRVCCRGRRAGTRPHSAQSDLGCSRRSSAD